MRDIPQEIRNQNGDQLVTFDRKNQELLNRIKVEIKQNVTKLENDI